MIDWMEQQQLDQERMEQENLEFYQRWADKMSPHDREILKKAFFPESETEVNPYQIEMACI